MKKLKPITPRRTPPKPAQGFGVFGCRFDKQGRQVDASGAVLDTRGDAMVDGGESAWEEPEETKRKAYG